MSRDQRPEATRCPECGLAEPTTVCRLCKVDKRPGADEQFERPQRYRRDEDQRLDDPRHGQARDINRRLR